jgi:hypothetical protein
MITVVTWKQIFKVFYRHNHIMVNAALFLRHIYCEHLYNLAHRHRRVLHELGSHLFGTDCCEALAHHVQVGSGVEGF